MWGGRWLEHLAQDLRYALRIFRRNPGFALVAILSLDARRRRQHGALPGRRRGPPPVAAGRRSLRGWLEVRLVDMDGARGNFETWRPAVTYPIWQAIEARQQAFSGVFAWGTDTFNLTDRRRDPHRAEACGSPADFFGVLGLQPGRRAGC